MIATQLTEAICRINLPTDQGKRLITKNPMCESTVSDTRTTLTYPRSEVVGLTSILKYRRKSHSSL